MKIQTGNYFETNFEEKFDGIITDPPYKGCISGKLEEKAFDIEAFMVNADRITKKDSFLVIFTNFAMSLDLRVIAEKTNWKFHTYQIWNKEPTRTWISWSIPTRTCEFVMYFKKGSFKYSFKNGIIKPKVNRNSFGGKLKETNPNTNEVSEGMYSEIVTYTNPRGKIHPTQKPIEFSQQFYQMFGDVKVLDPFCGSGALISKFPSGLGLDIKEWK